MKKHDDATKTAIIIFIVQIIRKFFEIKVGLTFKKAVRCYRVVSYLILHLSAAAAFRFSKP